MTIGLAFFARPIIIAPTAFVRADPIYPRISPAFDLDEIRADASAGVPRAGKSRRRLR
jgi:hypothetical protein